MSKTSPYESGELTDSIFLILISTIKPIHGYKIMQKIKTITENSIVIGPATMYTTLKKMKSVEWICETAEKDGKILYQITEKGKEILITDYEKKKKILEIAKKEMEDRYE